ncbi:hypothetical protein DKX38_003233 [Salix brachista]|uniref:Uncharacterized protein n=1 Tax=Salix brachista TaxID=2182728 RepID=A0A5N5NPA0_9ROSI|nr:hypothetical protein DKX38_003233 [Salix brachista]
MAACALNQRLICFSNSYYRTVTNPCSTWLPRTKTIVFSIPRNKGRLSLTSWTSQSSSEANTQTAESCVSLGLSLFSKGRVKDALVQFETALDLDPTPREAQAALYNKACCHAYL